MRERLACPRPTATGTDLTLCGGCSPPLTHQSRHPARALCSHGRPASHRGDNGNPLTRWYWRVESLREPHVLVTHVDVDEPAQSPGVVDDPAAQAGVGGVQAGQDFAQGPSVAVTLA